MIVRGGKLFFFFVVDLKIFFCQSTVHTLHTQGCAVMSGVHTSAT